MVEKCEWARFYRDDYVYITECGRVLELGGTATEYGYQYCPFCGKPIADTLIED